MVKRLASRVTIPPKDCVVPDRAVVIFLLSLILIMQTLMWIYFNSNMARLLRVVVLGGDPSHF